VAVAAIGVLIVVSGTARGLDGKPLDMVGLGLTGVAGLVRFLGAVTAVVAGTAVAWPIVARSWRDHGWARAVGKRIPWLGSAARSAEGAAWSRAASLAAHAGLSPGELVDLASAAAPGLSIKRTLLEGRLRQGHDLAEALGEVGRLPREVLEAIAVGEMTGNTAETLDRTAGRLEEAAIRGSAAAVRAVGFVAWALVAALVAMLVIRVASVYVGMIQDAARPM
jgi:type IV pilus assembly protein PilC